MSSVTESLNTDVTGIIGSYLDPQPNKNYSWEKASLAQQVNAILETSTLIEAAKASALPVFQDIRLAQKEENRFAYDDSAILIAELAYHAGLGKDFQRINTILNDKKVSDFDLRNRTLPWDLPRYIAFKKAIELACVHNQPKMMHYLLNHPHFLSLSRTKIVELSLTRWESRHPNHPRVEAKHQRNFVATYKKEAGKSIFYSAAESSARSGSAACLRLLFTLDKERMLQTYIPSLIQAASQNKECKKIIVENMDTSEPDWF